MRIDNWPLDRIMRLPDWCFGRRWWLGEYMGHTAGNVNYLLGAENLPDKFVVWGIYISCRSINCLEAIRLTIRLGTVLPAAAGDVEGLDRIFKGICVPAITYEFCVNPNGVTWVNCERQIIESAGRRLVMISNGDGTIAYYMTVGMHISALPKEVPDWLFSETVRNP